MSKPKPKTRLINRKEWTAISSYFRLIQRNIRISLGDNPDHKTWFELKPNIDKISLNKAEKNNVRD